MKKGTLYQYDQELTQMENSVIYHINRGRIADFYKDNRVYLQTIYDDIRTIQKAYFKYDENDKIVFEGEGQERKPVYVEGKSDMGYQKQWDILMSQNFTQKFVLGEVEESIKGKDFTMTESEPSASDTNDLAQTAIIDGKEVVVPVEPMH